MVRNASGDEILKASLMDRWWSLHELHSSDEFSWRFSDVVTKIGGLGWECIGGSHIFYLYGNIRPG